MNGWNKLRVKIIGIFILSFFFFIGLIKQLLLYFYIVIILFIFLSIPNLTYASTWQDVLTAYYSARVGYPGQKVWIEKTQGFYRLWRRPKISNAFMVKNYLINGTSFLSGGGGGVGACAGDASTVSVSSGTIIYTFTTNSQGRADSKYCDGSVSSVNGSPQYSSGVSATCYFSTVYSTSVNCKSGDVLLQEFDVTKNDCTVGNTLTVGSSVYGGLASKGCDCTPNGTEYADNSSGNCKYNIITGDPSSSSSPSITGDAPGFTHITTTTSAPPVTNPDGSIITTTTNTFPDGSNDVKTATTVNNVGGTTTTTTITERIVGGVSIGTTGTTITTGYTDGSTSSTSTSSSGTTTKTLSGGGTTQATSTYQSGLTSTQTTNSGGSTTIGPASGSGGVGTGGTGSGDPIKIDPEISTVVVPIASEKPAYSDSRLAGADGKTFGDFGSLFNDFSNGIKSTSLFSRFNFNEFSNSISGAASSPTYELSFGRFGTHNMDLSKYSSALLILKGIMLILASYIGTRIVVLKR